jgi:uncharacterized protein
MYRELTNGLLKWKTSKRRKPLLLQGARQVGKTWLIEDFAIQSFSNLIKVNFEYDTDIHSVFELTLDPYTIIDKISLLSNTKIEAGSTLLFFDEIQACPRAITSLKYFYELAPQYHIIAAGSLLGVSIGTNANFPVGKVNFLTLYPMSFYEFLHAMKMSSAAKRIREAPATIDDALHNKLMDLMRLFIYIGGMPEVVASYIKNKDANEVREIQLEILKAYENDFVKYTTPQQAVKIREIWNSIAYQLGRVNKKFKYSDVNNRGRASNYDTTIEWLQNAGLVQCVNQIRTPKLPLKGYADVSKFKLYSLDTGLLGAMLRLRKELILKGDELFSAYNGALTENYVCNELTKATDTYPHYWVSNSEAEVDFVIELDDQIVALEVKSGMDRNTKSLRSYQRINDAKYVFRASPRKYSASTDGFINLGLYAVMGLPTLANEVGE